MYPNDRAWNFQYLPISVQCFVLQLDIKVYFVQAKRKEREAAKTREEVEESYLGASQPTQPKRQKIDAADDEVYTLTYVQCSIISKESLIVLTSKNYL